MERDEAKARGQALRSYLQLRLPLSDASSVTTLARKAGIRPNTMTAWWTHGTVPDHATLRLLADSLGVDLSDLIAAYEGGSQRTWVLTDPELEALLERAAETAVRRMVLEREPGGGG